MSKNIKLERSESLLKEILPAALSTLSDNRINSLNITDVDCARGKYDANVYIDAPFASEEEKKEILKQLRVASSIIEEYCLGATGWYRCPKFHYKFDESLDRVKRLDELFDRIKKSK